MARPSLRSRLPVLLFAALLAACGGTTPPPESPEKTDKPETSDKATAPEADTPKDPSAPAAPDEAGSANAPAPAGPKVASGMSLDTYEMTPSDCNALGRKYGDVQRSDQMAALSPKLSEKQRSSTAAQIDKVVGKLEESWTDGCHNSLVNKAVDHDALKCALAAKTVKDFDVCLNGASGTPQPAAAPKKKK